MIQSAIRREKDDAPALILIRKRLARFQSDSARIEIG
jgi:hypothetical protein